MLPPEGHPAASSGQVCHLQKSLYGLKQASRQWNTEFCGELLDFGFSQSYDHCFFYQQSGSHFTCLIIYVDDVLVTGSDPQCIAALKAYLDRLFTIKELGFAKYFLRVELARDAAGTYLNQRKYILDILANVGMMDCRPASTPFPQGLKLVGKSGILLTDPDKYCRLVGRLLYLNLTRPDITFCVQQLGQFVNSLSSSHWDAAIHVLGYLKGCPSKGFYYSAGGDSSLVAYCDADWATYPNTRRSVTGYCIFLGGSLISWKTKKQCTVSRSSAEAEYRALSMTVCELQWISYIASNFQLSIPTPIPLFCDNQGTLHIVANLVFHECTKHLDIDCHLVRDQFKSSFVIPQKVSSHLQLADMFTKALGPVVFAFLTSKLGMKDLHLGPT
ncbi:hypothetical protein DH2020_028316 [Rehmannia glutinosa]|uniref:Reverse transcriptase Ty1/copia-type domain-containing protein n=1 Tax=Rehmannia glutinosa TaxID=99300 RepID=A0ABR0VTG0_REHGL